MTDSQNSVILIYCASTLLISEKALQVSFRPQALFKFERALRGASGHRVAMSGGGGVTSHLSPSLGGQPLGERGGHRQYS